MGKIKTAGLLAALAAGVLLLNGWINYRLFQPQPGAAPVINTLRRHLDDGAFALLFLTAGLVFVGMAAAMKERGYGQLGLFALFASAQLFAEWDEGRLLFGELPEVPYGSLAIKCGTAFLAFSFVRRLLTDQESQGSRAVTAAAGLLWAAIAAATALGAAEPVFAWLNALFLLLVFANIALTAPRFLLRLRREPETQELRWLAWGVLLFLLLLLPDIGKDGLEALLGRPLGYLPVFWEQALEDTFPWALLELLALYGLLFLRRFLRTLEANRAAVRRLELQNAALGEEADLRHRLDEWLSVLTRAYRVPDLEQSVVREGARYFAPAVFRLMVRDPDSGNLRVAGEPMTEEERVVLERALRERAGQPGGVLQPGEVAELPGFLLGAAGRGGGAERYLVLSAGEGELPAREGREWSALRLMARYVSIFLDYFALLENRLAEWERSREEQPWVSKLFLQLAEKERKRLASDLHDEVLQELLHVRRQADGLSAALPAPLAAGMDRLLLGLDNAEFLIRETCRELMPSFLAERGVGRAVDRLVEKTRLRADFELRYRAEPLTEELGEEEMVTVYRVIQELLSNAGKHSEAGTVDLFLGQKDGDVVIRYADDGKGVELKQAMAAERLGLRGMAERLKVAGGSVQLDSAPGRGMKAVCVLPVRELDQERAGAIRENPA